MDEELEMDDVIEDAVEGYEVEDEGDIYAYVKSKFQRAKLQRRWDEQRWLKAYRNYRGIYGPDVVFRSTEKSKIFVKVTKTKVLAAFGQITEVLLGGERFPLTIDPTTLPEGVEEAVHFDPQMPADQDPNASLFGQTLKPGDTIADLIERTGSLKEKLEPVADKLRKGPGTTPTSVTFFPSMIAAKRMEKKVHDQLEESGANKHLRLSAFECALFGHGVMKGPFLTEKVYPKWEWSDDEEGEPTSRYNPVKKIVPRIKHTSVWNFYPDPDSTCIDDAEWVIERHRMGRSQMHELKTRPLYDKDAISRVIKGGASYTKEWWEDHVEDGEQNTNPERWEVLEFWGHMDRELLEENNVSIPSDIDDDEDIIAVNVWICNGEVLRFIVNPFRPSKIPYHAFPYEINPYSFFGVGVAENMDDTQHLMNGAMRMAVDNAALSGNLIFEVDEQNLVAGQDLEVYPGKMFRRDQGAVGQVITPIEYPNVSAQNLQLFDKARQLSDESTGMPSFAHGQTGVTGVGRTSSGISMLMNAANGSIRTVIKNIDDYLLAPLGSALYHFNMQFDFDKEVAGDYEVKARGTESLVSKDIRSQRLMQFLGMVQNPVLAPFAKMDYIIREIAKAMELDPDKVVNSMTDAALQAEMLKAMAPGTPGPADGAAQGPANPEAGPDSMGGNIGPMTPAEPGAPGHSANTGQVNVDQAPNQ